MSDVDTMRWGDTQSLSLLAASGESANAFSKQMLQANWQRPVVWRVMLSISASIGADDAALTFDVQPILFIGVGQANAPVPLPPVHFATPFASSVQFFDIPAESIIMQFAILNLSNAAHADSSINVAAFVAPHAEPGAIVQMRDKMGAPRHWVDPPDLQGQPHWMREGFDDGQLRYRNGG